MTAKHNEIDMSSGWQGSTTFRIFTLCGLLFTLCLSSCKAKEEVASDPPPPSVDLPPLVKVKVDQAEERIATLKSHIDRLDAQSAQVRRLIDQGEASSRASARLAETKAQRDQLIQRMNQLKELIEELKLKAVTGEASLEVSEMDDHLTDLLKGAVDSYDQLDQLETLRLRGMNGDPIAQFELGKRYEKGDGVEESMVEALRWYVKAAEQNHPEAALAAGYCYRKGKGTKADPVEAFKWYKKSAVAGNPLAASNVGVAYLRGRGVKVNLKEAVRWLREAAQQGIVTAQLYLSDLYVEGKGVSRDLVQARHWLVEAQGREHRKRAKEKLEAFDAQHKDVISREMGVSIRWVALTGGTFSMGHQDRADDARPRREVQIAPFSMSVSEVTVEQYRRCVMAGVCERPPTGQRHCTYHKTRHDQLPMNCVTWDQARRFATWVGADLPSEAEWEYAARSQGNEQSYPWGKEKVTCDRAVVMGMKRKQGSKESADKKGCGRRRASKVCSRPSGLSTQGVCDLIGNVAEWTLDEYYPSYQGAPKDHQPRCAQENCASSQPLIRVVRGGHFASQQSESHALARAKSKTASPEIGFRVVKR